MKTLNSIEAAKMEIAGEGSFSITGRKITFKRNDGYQHDWNCKTNKAACDTLKLFRASAKYVK